MQYGTSFSLDWLADLGAIKEGAKRLDESDIDYVSVGGHVLSAAPGRYPSRPTPTYGVTFRDPFVLFSHLSASTSRLRFRTGILILPMMPTVLVAKQAADLAIVSEGRFELGVGISWQQAEYDAMGREMRQRGKRFDEQLEVLRLMWSEPLVSFHGEFHDIDELGIGGLPPGSDIPIWIGCGRTPALLERVAKRADGWMPLGEFDLTEPVEILRRLSTERSSPIGVAARLVARPDELAACVAEAQALAKVGASAIAIAPPAGAPITEGIAAVLATQAAIAAELD